MGSTSAGAATATPGAPQVAEVAPPSASAAAVKAAIAQLEQQLRAPAGDPDSPWALAHGLLAFGKDFETRDGRSAVPVAASFAARAEGGDARYRFPVERAGKAVEPHPHLLIKTFLEVGVPLAAPLRAADGTKLDVRRLLTDMRASVHEPTNEAEWRDAAWWLSALELAGHGSDPAHARLREAALSRLEADDAVLEAAQGPEPFAASAPMGAAKRAKTHIYGHPCGGLHFVQAVLRGAAASDSAPQRARARRQLALLLQRYEAERALYAGTLRSHPGSRLLVSGQQLKFFGHLLETLALASELGLLREDAALAAEVDAARRRAAADVLVVLGQLDQEHAYERLDALAVERPQLRLDLIGDGCHALHGLRQTLRIL